MDGFTAAFGKTIQYERREKSTNTFWEIRVNGTKVKSGY